jgi:adenine-specific DNA-methyltransferase
MARQSRDSAVSRSRKRHIENYTHEDKERLNNPPVGLVTPETDRDPPPKTYVYDPHLEPQLAWAGKSEHTSFQAPTISLHVHERVDPYTIIQAVKKRNGGPQLSLFAAERTEPLRLAVDFYKHKHNWTNRLIAGDSLLVMNSLLEKEGMAGAVQMVYIDPPYGISYRSNFQPFVNKKDAKDGKDEDLTQEPEMVKAFRDTWELGIHSYLTYLRDRLLLARELLDVSGSVFVQINDTNLHHAREILDEVFRSENFVSLITFQTTSGFQTKTIATLGDFLLWYAKDKKSVKVRKLYEPQPLVLGEGNASWVLLPNGTYRGVKAAEKRREKQLPEGAKLYYPDNTQSQGAAAEPQPFEYNGKTYEPGPNSHWKAHYPEGMKRLAAAGRLHVAENSLRYRRFHEDFPYQERGNIWTDTITGNFTDPKIYAVQTNRKVIERCILLSTDPGDLVFDPTCGSGTTAVAAEEWGRRWATCDTSRIALAVARQRVMTEVFPYYQLARPEDGIASGLLYEQVPHITLEQIAQGEKPEPVSIYDDAVIDRTRVRIAGPFTVEAVPAPTVKALDEIMPDGGVADASLVRSGETRVKADWRDELFKTGIRGEKGQRIEFSRVEPFVGTRWLNADAETKEDPPQRAVIVFGPEYAPLEQRQVARAIEEAQALVPRPKLIVFAAFEFDPEAAKDIDETNWRGVKLLKAKMNADLLTDDLKKKRASNESFWLIGQPDVRLEIIKTGEDKGKVWVQLEGFDYYDVKTGTIVSGDASKIAMWMLDSDYDGRCLFPQQMFLPMAGAKDGWAKLAKDLKAEIDETLIERYRGTRSLPFEIGEHRRAAVKIIDDRGIESFKIIGLD